MYGTRTPDKLINAEDRIILCIFLLNVLNGDNINLSGLNIILGSTCITAYIGTTARKTPGMLFTTDAIQSSSLCSIPQQFGIGFKFFSKRSINSSCYFLPFFVF
eukprot:UN29995